MTWRLATVITVKHLFKKDFELTSFNIFFIEKIPNNTLIVTFLNMEKYGKAQQIKYSLAEKNSKSLILSITTLGKI